MPAWLSGGLSRAMRNEPLLSVCVFIIYPKLPCISFDGSLCVDAVVVHMFECHGVDKREASVIATWQ